MTLCANRPRSCPNIFSDFKCANGNCVDRSKICDLKDDCDDRTDEKGCHEEGKCEDEIGGKLFCLSKLKKCFSVVHDIVSRINNVKVFLTIFSLFYEYSHYKQ
jgi:hypothetical protein